MRLPNEIEAEINSMTTLTQLSGVFEGLASMQIARVKNQVLQSQEFFNTLWQMYSQIRVDAVFNFGRRTSSQDIIDKELFVIITAEGGFSGDIDQKLIEWMSTRYDKDKNEIIVIGHHGAVQLAQAGISYKRYYKLPTKDTGINVAPIIKEVQLYSSTRVFYQTYVSLTIQDVKSISLSAMVEEQGRNVAKSSDIISDENYIFEPSTYAVVDHLERSMLQISLTQVILESKLAQYASRFRAMSAAHQKAEDSVVETTMEFNRTKRSIKDERLRETINSISSARKAQA